MKAIRRDHGTASDVGAAFFNGLGRF
jgi:hypothetical protein